MALTESQSSRLSATIAENAAAEAKSYAIKAGQAEDFSNQAQASAEAAAVSAISSHSSAVAAEEAMNITLGQTIATIRVPDGETLSVLPVASERKGKFPGFDPVTGDVKLIDISSTDASALALSLASSGGSELVGTPNGTVEDRFTSVETALADKASMDALSEKISGAVTFIGGGVLNSEKDFIYNNADLSWYFWSGAYDETGKVILPSSTPESTGGVGPGKWLNVGDTMLRSELAGPDGAALVGDSPVAGSVSGRVSNVLDRIGISKRSFISLYEVMPTADWGVFESDETALAYGSVSGYIDEAMAYASSKKIPLVMPTGTMYIDRKIDVLGNVEFCGAGINNTRIKATAGFTGDTFVNADKAGQGFYHIHSMWFNAGGKNARVLILGGSQNARIYDLLLTDGNTAGFTLASTVGGDIVNPQISGLWTLRTDIACDVFTGSGNITDATISNCQFVARDTGQTNTSAIRVASTANKQIFGLKFDRCFTASVDSPHVIVDSSAGGNIYGNTFSDITGESHNISGGLSDGGAVYTVQVKGANTFNNTFDRLFHQSVLGNGILVDASHSNKFKGMRFFFAAAAKAYVTCQNGAYDNEFMEFSINGRGRIAPTATGYDLLGTQFKGDALQLNRLSSPEITSLPVSVLTLNHLKKITAGDFTYFPMTNKSGVDASIVGEEVRLGIIARALDTAITIPFTYKTGDRIALSIRYSTNVAGVTVVIPGKSFTLLGLGGTTRTYVMESDALTTTGTTVLTITIPAASSGTFTIQDICVSLNGLSVLQGARPSLATQF